MGLFQAMRERVVIPPGRVTLLQHAIINLLAEPADSINIPHRRPESGDLGQCQLDQLFLVKVDDSCLRFNHERDNPMLLSGLNALC